MIARAKKLIVFLLLALFIYSPFVKVGGNILNLPKIFLFVYGLAGLPFLFRSYSRNRLFRNTFNTKVAGVFVLLLLFLAHGARDDVVFYLVLPGFAAVSGAFIFVELYRRIYGNDFQYKLILHVFYVGVIHGLIMIAVLIDLDMAMLFQRVFAHSEKALASWVYRSPGILTEGFSRLSIVQTMTFICGMALLLSGGEKKLSYRYIEILFGSLIILVSTIISGKTGFILFCVGVVIFSWLVITGKREVVSGKSKRFMTIAVSSIVLFVVLLALYGINAGYADMAIGGGLEMFFNYQESGAVSTRSTDIILDRMYFAPDGWLNNLIGTGDYVQETDVGFVALLFGAGAIGIASVLLFYIYLGFRAYKARENNYMLSWIMVFFCLTVIIANFKDFTFDDMLGLTQVFSLCYVLLISTYPYRRNVTRRLAV
jgi:hypothetical protein